MPRSEQTRALVLDTHVWLWLMEGDSRLSVPARERLEQAVSDGNLFVSAISVWELAMLEAKGRVTFDEDCGTWVRSALDAPGISLAPLTPEIAMASTRLPGGFHGDPADRIIAATARLNGGTVVTADKRILSYGRTGHLAVLSA